jgi:multidrug resistance efflux pump
LSKYTITAPIDGIVLSIAGRDGSYVSSQGAYEYLHRGISAR